VDDPKRNELYGDAVNDPKKFCRVSLGAGKGDRNRISDLKKFRDNYDSIFNHASDSD
jgi:hypothetical protein